MGFYGESKDNVTIEGFSFKCNADGTDGLKYGVHIFNSNNLTIKKCELSTRYFGIYIYGINGFVIDDIHFNQVRTLTYSNKDGIHINGNTHNGYIHNIYGTTDDDLIALNADEPNQIFGDITNIVIDNVVTQNEQENGLADSTYRPVRLLSYGSLIDNIVFKNCNVQSDVEECILLSGDENARIGKIIIDESVLTKNHSKSSSVIYAETPYDNIIINKCKLIINTTASGAFYNSSQNDSLIRKNITFKDCELIDNSSTERAYLSFSGDIENITIDNCNTNSDNYFQFISCRACNIENINLSNMTSEYCRYFTRLLSDSVVKRLNINNCNVNKAIAGMQIEGLLSKLNVANFTTLETTNITNIEADQENLEISYENINTNLIKTLSATNHTTNIRLIRNVITDFIPEIGKTGDEFILVPENATSGSSATKYIYSMGAWHDIVVN